MQLLDLFLLQQKAAAQPQGFQAYSGLILMVVLILIFWLFFIRPQSKKQKEIQRQRAALTTGDKVVTSGGIMGTIREVHDSYFLIEVDANTRIRFDKSAVYASPEDRTASGK